MTRACAGRPLRLLVCGDRLFAAAAHLRATLDAFADEHRVAVLIEGEAPGADALAREWAHARGIPVAAYPADAPGRAESSRRNARMLREGRPDYVIAFLATTLADSPGTADMVARARAANVPTRVVPPP